MNWRGKFLFLILSLASAPEVFAHGGGLDGLGCHHTKKQGIYHCHRGVLVGQEFPSKDNALKTEQGSQEQLTKPLKGTARVVDGDTIWIGNTKIRLHGIDAPETRQKCISKDRTKYNCGKASTDALRVLVGGDSVRCEGETFDRYRRLIATCYSGSLNLNAELVRQGWAIAYRRYSKDYISAEKEAQETKRGMWAGEFTPPWKWRRK
jgi:endonuclease YncB( thermonuclease family)